MSLSVGFVSLGCSKNLVDTQVMAGFLKDGKITLAHSPEEADLILVNTCAFIEAAREEAVEHIEWACERKASGLCKAVVVAGCMVQRYKEDLAKACPDVDAFIGVDQLEKIADIVNAIDDGTLSRKVVAGNGKNAKVYTPAHPDLVFTGGPFAYLKIAEGCDHRCAFCAIPGIRGSFRSRSFASILEEAKALIGAGVRELNLIAQDVLRYGKDFAKTSQIVDLLEQLDSLDGDFRIRLLYGYPSAVTQGLLQLIASSRHILRYLDVPVQHSDPSILRAMGRADAIEATQDFADKLRSEIPGIVLRTTCLVGFPGESKKAFEQLCEYVENSRFDHLGVFAFSPEEGTKAFGLTGQVSAKVASRRCEELMQIQRAVVAERLQKELKGSQSEALLIGKDKGKWHARLPRQAPEVDGITFVSGVPATAKSGDFLQVRITGGRDYDLFAKTVSGE